MGRAPRTRQKAEHDFPNGHHDARRSAPNRPGRAGRRPGSHHAAGALRWRYLGLVALGGAVGTALRDPISTAFPAHHGVSWAIFWIDITGALLLGVLLEALAHRGPDAGRRRTLRLLVGTGVLGGFTTDSTLAVSTAALFLDGRALAGTGHALLTVLAGAVATAIGLTVASSIRPRPDRTEQTVRAPSRSSWSPSAVASAWRPPQPGLFTRQRGAPRPSADRAPRRAWSRRCG